MRQKEIENVKRRSFTLEESQENYLLEQAKKNKSSVSKVLREILDKIIGGKHV